MLARSPKTIASLASPAPMLRGSTHAAAVKSPGRDTASQETTSSIPSNGSAPPPLT
jgi:hypothetical protein